MLVSQKPSYRHCGRYLNGKSLTGKIFEPSGSKVERAEPPYVPLDHEISEGAVWIVQKQVENIQLGKILA